MTRFTEYQITRLLFVVLICVLTLIFASPFLVPIFFAATISLALFPLLLRLEKKGLGRKKAAILLTTAFTFVISIPIFFFLVRGTLLVTDQLHRIHSEDKGVQDLVTGLKQDVIQGTMKYAHKFHLDAMVTTEKINFYFNQVTGFLLNFFQVFAGSLPLLFLYLLIMILCTYSMLKNAQGIRNYFQRLFGFDDHLMNRLVAIFIGDSRQVYVSNIATGAIQSLLIAAAAALTGAAEFFLVFFVTLILSFIPVIGASPVGFVVAGFAYFKGLTTPAIIIACVAGFAGVIDNLLRPWLNSLGESKIPPIASFIFVLGGALLLGFPGLFIGILVGSIAYDTLPLFWEELGKSELRVGKTDSQTVK